MVLNDTTISQIESALGYRFADPKLLDLALTHASAVEDRLQSNERLEFLGDAVLGLVTCQRLFELYPDLGEGDMTKVKSSVVSRQACADIATRMGLADHIVVGKGMRTSQGLPSSIAAGVLEAVIAAVMLDGGFEPAAQFVRGFLDEHLSRALDSGHQENFKSVLQTHAQRLMGASPVYKVLDEKGPDHAKAYKVAIDIAGRRFPPAWAQSKKQAEQLAAQIALRELGILTQSPSGELRVVDEHFEGR